MLKKSYSIQSNFEDCLENEDDLNKFLVIQEKILHKLCSEFNIFIQSPKVSPSLSQEQEITTISKQDKTLQEEDLENKAKYQQNESDEDVKSNQKSNSDSIQENGHIKTENNKNYILELQEKFILNLPHKNNTNLKEGQTNEEAENQKKLQNSNANNLNVTHSDKDNPSLINSQEQSSDNEGEWKNVSLPIFRKLYNLTKKESWFMQFFYTFFLLIIFFYIIGPLTISYVLIKSITKIRTITLFGLISLIIFPLQLYFFFYHLANQYLDSFTVILHLIAFFNIGYIILILSSFNTCVIYFKAKLKQDGIEFLDQNGIDKQKLFIEFIDKSKLTLFQIHSMLQYFNSLQLIEIGIVVIFVFVLVVDAFGKVWVRFITSDNPIVFSQMVLIILTRIMFILFPLLDSFTDHSKIVEKNEKLVYSLLRKLQRVRQEYSTTRLYLQLATVYFIRLGNINIKEDIEKISEQINQLNFKEIAQNSSDDKQGEFHLSVAMVEDLMTLKEIKRNAKLYGILQNKDIHQEEEDEIVYLDQLIKIYKHIWQDMNINSKHYTLKFLGLFEISNTKIQALLFVVIPAILGLVIQKIF